jgi:hypothetical protein
MLRPWVLSLAPGKEGRKEGKYKLQRGWEYLQNNTCYQGNNGFVE